MVGTSNLGSWNGHWDVPYAGWAMRVLTSASILSPCTVLGATWSIPEFDEENHFTQESHVDVPLNQPIRWW